MNLSIASNQSDQGQLALLDETNPATVVTAVFSGVSASSDTPAVATVAVDAQNNINVSGVAAGTANITVNATAAYTDSLGAAQSKALSVTIPVTVTQAVVADQVVLTVNFGAPTIQGAPAAAAPTA